MAVAGAANLASVIGLALPVPSLLPIIETDPIDQGDLQHLTFVYPGVLAGLEVPVIPPVIVQPDQRTAERPRTLLFPETPVVRRFRVEAVAHYDIEFITEAIARILQRSGASSGPLPTPVMESLARVISIAKAQTHINLDDLKVTINDRLGVRYQGKLMFDEPLDAMKHHEVKTLVSARMAEFEQHERIRRLCEQLLGITD